MSSITRSEAKITLNTGSSPIPRNLYEIRQHTKRTLCIIQNRGFMRGTLLLS
ncbi:hypothetical protein PGB90_010038 [Kerria lacca]